MSLPGRSSVLPDKDLETLARLGRPYRVVAESGVICVTIEGYELPPGLEPSAADLLVRLPGSWPDGQPDMFWMDPPVRVRGALPPATDYFQSFLGRTWQRWSRHLQGGWGPADDLGTWLRVIRSELMKAAQ